MVLSYNCPKCGGDMIFSPKEKKLYCSHCNTVTDIGPDNIEEKDGEKGEDKGEYHCPDCGGLLKTDEKETSMVCEYCGASVVISDRLTDKMRPVWIIPFKKDRADAEAAFKKWSKNGRFTPKGFVGKDNLKKIKGIYVPYWLFDAEMNTQLRATGTKVRIYRVGDTEYTETSFYDIYRDADTAYSGVPCDGSVKLEDSMMEKLEPYDYKEAEHFVMPYLAGYHSNQYDLDDKAVEGQVLDRLNSYALDLVRSTISGYSGLTITSQLTRPVNVNASYALLPVWFFSYGYQGATYSFAMNGQTGKVIGKPPLSKGRVAAWAGGISAAVFAVLTVIGVFI